MPDVRLGRLPWSGNSSSNRQTVRILTTSLLALNLIGGAASVRGESGEGLVGSWSFDQREGNLLLDQSAGANHAIVRNGLLVKGVNGLGLQFDGKTTSATCPSSPALAVDKSLTIEAWLCLHQIPTSGLATVVRRDGAFALRFSDGRLGFLLWLDDAKRESRRLVGDYVLTQNDVQAATVFADRISYGGWPLDVHHPEGVFSGEEGPFDYNVHVPIYTIPFRCLYSKNIDNLLFAGRNMSVSHVALGTVRVQGTLAPLGQVAGTAAALCLQRDVTPRGLYRAHIGHLQQTLLKYDLTIPGIVNEDPEDLAKSATAAASSTARFEPFGRRCVQADGEMHPLNMPRAVMIPRGLKEHWNSVSLLLASSRAEPARMTLRVCEASGSGDFSNLDDAITSTAMVPPGKESFVEFPLGRVLDKPFV